jgi:hypothetical protein
MWIANSTPKLHSVGIKYSVDLKWVVDLWLKMVVGEGSSGKEGGS